MRNILLALFICAGFVFPGAIAQSRGDFVLTFGTASLISGGSGSVDVFISGDGSSLGRFFYQFDIAGASAQSGDLQFASVQLKTEQGDGSYVFNGDVDDPNLSTHRDTNIPTTAIGDDSTFSGNAISITTPRLLARLELQHLGTGVGTFTISLNIANSEFDADADFLTDNSYAAQQINSVAGSITVSAVPEPGSIALLSLACVGLSAFRRSRKSCRAR